MGRRSQMLRARAEITSHFDISSSSHFWQILKTKNLEIVHYYCAFCSLKSTKPNLNLSAKNVKLFMREPLMLQPTVSVHLFLTAGILLRLGDGPDLLPQIRNQGITACPY